MSAIPDGAVTPASDGAVIHCLATPRASRNAVVA